jgi:hypothetical protein
VRKEAVVRARIEAAHAFAKAAVLVPTVLACLSPALRLHELMLQMPSRWVAIERTASRPRRDYARIPFVRFAEPSELSNLRTRSQTQNLSVASRSIVVEPRAF